MKKIDKHELAKRSIHNRTKFDKGNSWFSGSVSVSYGGLNHIRFLKNGSFDVSTMKIGKDRLNELNNHLILFFYRIAANRRRSRQELCGRYRSKRKAIEQNAKDGS